ncbi:hypothetical protein M413DRAFT_439009 [Hebeloma cylindrosporum]|uniref:Uncharacterized protein n=1 Tax=Hebeloma cylindrosporum TaxID=76867 RepID=A0A0C2Z9Q2_HEBCY|nr:hypothetical protein M413DRAFT_439009 [Hebeloma cylindrosporum h7]
MVHLYDFRTDSIQWYAASKKFCEPDTWAYMSGYMQDYTPRDSWTSNTWDTVLQPAYRWVPETMGGYVGANQSAKSHKNGTLGPRKIQKDPHC